MAIKYILIESDSALTADSLSFLKQLDQDHFPTPWGDESWNKIFQSVGQKFIMISESEGEKTGFALFDKSVADSFAHLLKIVINPTVRGQGQGKALLNEAIRVLKEQGTKSFFLEVEEDNNSAINLYQQAGFKIIHHKKQFYSNGASALIMTLSI